MAQQQTRGSGRNIDLAERKNTFAQLMERAKPILQRSLPRHVDATRMMQLAQYAVTSNPKLLEADQRSVIGAVIQAGQLGLEPNTPVQHCWILPYWNKRTKSYNAQLIIGYKGMIQLAYGSSIARNVSVHPVYSGDHFRFQQGTDEKIEHEWNLLAEDRGDMIGVYTIIEQRDGAKHHEVMSIHDVHKVKERTSSRDRDGNIVGPWITDFEQMALKTVVKRALKYMPLSPVLAHAVALDSSAEAGEQDLGSAIPGEVVQPDMTTSERGKGNGQTQTSEDRREQQPEGTGEQQGKQADTKNRAQGSDDKEKPKGRGRGKDKGAGKGAAAQQQQAPEPPPTAERVDQPQESTDEGSQPESPEPAPATEEPESQGQVNNSNADDESDEDDAGNVAPLDFDIDNFNLE